MLRRFKSNGLKINDNEKTVMAQIGCRTCSVSQMEQVWKYKSTFLIDYQFFWFFFCIF